MKRTTIALTQFAIAALLLPLATANAQQRTQKISGGFRISEHADSVELTAVAPSILRVVIRPGGVHDERTPVLDPAFHAATVSSLSLRSDSASSTIRTSDFVAKMHSGAQLSLDVSDSHGASLLAEKNLFEDSKLQTLQIERSDSDPVYGIHGIKLNVEGAVLTRDGKAVVAAGEQGNGGAPMFFTRHYAVLVDSSTGDFTINGTQITFQHPSRKELEFYILVGDPLQTRRGIADLSGHAPMPPRWTLGFLNSQWGLDEKELRAIVQRYRDEHVPLDGFIMDFDWKAWGEDNYGEWRWNSTSGAGSVAPDKFPDGASSKLATDLLASGVHLAGILKPRILMYKYGSKTDLHEAATYAQQHNLFYPGEPEIIDYFSVRPSRDLNFNLPETRTWFWQHLVPSFDAGINAWWSDEADSTDLPNGKTFYFDSLQFLNMGRALYDGQRAHSDKRVWTINRNYFMGAQRYGYAEWSGDIQTGVKSMKEQPVRMLSTINLNEANWSMDTGGFIGHPTPEVYARWMEFAAFVPIFRVHGDHGEKRQPWVYGSTAQAAAQNAMKLRYELMPYIYSAQRNLYETGIGVVRPLSWIYPDDPQVAAEANEWMFGDGLLVAPILEEQKVKPIYLPAGIWWDYANGKQWNGGQTISWPVDTKNWSDIPLFVRAGSILATAPAAGDTDAMHPAEVGLDIFPSTKPTSFTYYEDDGATYSYEKGVYFRQQITATSSARRLQIHLDAHTGSYKPSLQTYLLRIHEISGDSLTVDGKKVVRTNASLTDSSREWTTSVDKFGPVTVLRVPANHAATINIGYNAEAPRKN